ncbi:MAG: MurR/RpiR family transcriptional regulator [Lachnospiraceae bacterium]
MNQNLSVLGTICSSYDSYFEAEKKIADCIIERKEDVIDMTVAELAAASGTSDATVSRFCRRCGFKGFLHLKMTLAKEVMEEQGKGIQISNDIDRGDIAQSLQNILANKVAELTQTVSMINPELLETILALLERAKTVQVVAVGNTVPVALDFSFKLNQIGIPSVSGTIWETQMAYTLNQNKDDVIVIISNSGTSKRLLALIQGAQENGIPIVAITNRPESPVAQQADYHLTTATREKLLLGEFCFSRVSATMVAELLYLFLAVSKNGAYDAVRRHEVAIAEDKEV